MTRKNLTNSLSKFIDRLAHMWLNREMIATMEKKPPKTYQEYQDQAERDYVVKELVTRRNQGKSLREIGEEVGLSYEQVRKLLMKYGYK